MESVQLLKLKVKISCDERLVKAQRYACLNDGKSKLIASILGTLEELTLKVKTNNDEEGILLVTITMYTSTKNIMIQGIFFKLG